MNRIRERQEKAAALAKERMQKLDKWEAEEKKKKQKAEQAATSQVLQRVEEFKASPEYIQMLENKEARR